MTTKQKFTITVECEPNDKHPGFGNGWDATKAQLTAAIKDALERSRAGTMEMPAKRDTTIVTFSE
jgi:hypothetical protein